MPDRIDITDRATAAGWSLPPGWRVLAWTEPDAHTSPRSRFPSDVEEAGRDRTRGFCAGCAAWLYRLDQDSADAINHERPADADPDDPAYAEAHAGDWASLATGVSCPGSGDHHELDIPVARRWWGDDRWRYVQVHVQVFDNLCQPHGHTSVSGERQGTFPEIANPMTGEITTYEFDPLNHPDHPVPQLMLQALSRARDELRASPEESPAISMPGEPPANPVVMDPQIKTLHDRLSELLDPEGDGLNGGDAVNIVALWFDEIGFPLPNLDPEECVCEGDGACEC